MSKQRVYVASDANWAEQEQAVLERLQYEPYGQVAVADHDGQEASGEGCACQCLHEGFRSDGGTSALHRFRHRDFSPSLGRWVQQDPMGYVDGMSLYEYVRSRPVDVVDAMGLAGGSGVGGPGYPGYPGGVAPTKGKPKQGTTWNWLNPIVGIGGQVFYVVQWYSGYVPPDDDHATADNLLYEFFNEVGPPSRSFDDDSLMTGVLKAAPAVVSARERALKQASQGNLQPVIITQGETGQLWDVTRMIWNNVTGWGGNLGYLGSYKGRITIKKKDSEPCTYILNFTARNAITNTSGGGWTGIDKAHSKFQDWDWIEKHNLGMPEDWGSLEGSWAIPGP